MNNILKDFDIDKLNIKDLTLLLEILNKINIKDNDIEVI